MGETNGLGVGEDLSSNSDSTTYDCMTAAVPLKSLSHEGCPAPSGQPPANTPAAEVADSEGRSARPPPDCSHSANQKSLEAKIVFFKKNIFIDLREDGRDKERQEQR